MELLYAGLDVSDKTTSVCIVTVSGRIVRRADVPTSPPLLAAFFRKHAPGLERAVLETGPLSTFLHHELEALWVPVVCICARHAKGVLSVHAHKSDVRDAEGLAHLCRTGWYREVHLKAFDTHVVRAHLRVREQLVSAHRNMINQLRGLLKLFGLRLGPVTTGKKREKRLDVLLAERPELVGVFTGLRRTLCVLEEEINAETRMLERTAQADPVCRRLLSVPGVGVVTALVYVTTIEDPGRFKRSSEVAAYAGLVPRQHQSGEMDMRGRITKRGDPRLRHALYEAANSILARLKKPCALKRWGLSLQKRKGAKRARVAVARKLAILLHALWSREETFSWDIA